MTTNDVSEYSEHVYQHRMAWTLAKLAADLEHSLDELQAALDELAAHLAQDDETDV